MTLVINGKTYEAGELIAYVENLEKENAELRRNEFNAKSCLELQQSQDKAIVNYMGEQLTKAKDIIKNLMVYVPVDLKEYEGAKQFLMENSTYERIQKAKYNYIN